jgi:hypothetical protein
MFIIGPVSAESSFSSIFYLISIGQLSVSVCSDIAFQSVHCIVWLKNLTAASVSSLALRETFKATLSLMRRLKSSQFVCVVLKLSCFSWFSAYAVSIKTSERSEDR